jgi:hypothetical protein
LSARSHTPFARVAGATRLGHDPGQGVRHPAVRSLRHSGTYASTRVYVIT